MNESTQKWWLSSKLVIFNIIGTIIGVLAILVDISGDVAPLVKEFVPESTYKYIILAITIINIVLRKLTNTAIVWKKPTQTLPQDSEVKPSIDSQTTG